MSTINGKSYQDPRNINLKGGSLGGGLIRWAPPVSGVPGLWSTNPFSTNDYGLYINTSGQLVFSSTGSLTILGAAGGGGGASSWNGLYAAGQILTISGTTMTFDGTHASNDVFTISNTAAGSGDLLQFINTGTGKDIKGTSGTWDFSALGAMTALSAVLAGTAGANSFTLTAGDVLLSDASITMTDADNAGTLVITNNTVSSSVFSTFTANGLTSGGGLLITSSGTLTTTGYLLTLTANSATTAAGILRINGNALTSGIGAVITSSATAITGAGRLLRVDHTGATGSTAILSEFASAANDETVIVKVTASSALALGIALQVSASSLTTGKAITASDLDALTTGMGVHIASSATAITTTGRMFLSDHTGATGTSATLNEFKTAATDETILLALTTAAMINGQALSIVGTTGMTTGSLIRATSSTAGAVATNGIYSFALTGDFTNGASTLGAFHVAGATTVAGTIMSILGGSQTTGIALNITDPGTGMTSGSLLRVISATTGAVATNGVVAIQASGDHTSTSNQGFVGISDATTAGTAVSISTTALTTGVGLYLANGTSGITSGSAVRVAVSGTGTIATNGIVSIRHAGIFASTSNAGVLDVQASALVGTGTVVNFKSTAASQTTANILNITQSGATLTGYTGSIVSITAGFSGAGSTGAAILLTAVHDVAGDALKIVDNALTLGTATLINLSHTTSVLGAGTSMLRITSTGVDTGTTTGTLLDLAATGNVSGVAQLITMSSGSQTTATALSVVQTTTATGYTGSLVKILGSSTTGAGNLFQVTGVHTTAGDAVKIIGNAMTLGAATLLNLSHTTSVLGAGTSMLRITSTGINTGTTTGTLIDLAATASTSATLVLVTSATTTTGIGLSMVLNGLTTGNGINIASSSTDSGVRGLIQLTASGVGSTGTSMIRMTQAVQSTNFRKIFTESGSGITLWWGNGTTGQGNLSGTAGDVLLNGGSNKPEYCTGTTNWTALV